MKLFSWKKKLRILQILLRNSPVEPLFGCAALYDVGKKERLSETFYFDFNGENMAQL